VKLIRAELEAFTKLRAETSETLYDLGDLISNERKKFFAFLRIMINNPLRCEWD
jgi:hypothetical protein